MYKQVYEHNDWGSIYYNFKRGGMSDWREREPLLQAGNIVYVKFKDGTIKKCKIVEEPCQYPINDMGHKYTVTTQYLGVNVNVRGIKVFITLDKLKVKNEETST